MIYFVAYFSFNLGLLTVLHDFDKDSHEMEWQDYLMIAFLGVPVALIVAFVGER